MGPIKCIACLHLFLKSKNFNHFHRKSKKYQESKYQESFSKAKATALQTYIIDHHIKTRALKHNINEAIRKDFYMHRLPKLKDL